MRPAKRREPPNNALQRTSPASPVSPLSFRTFGGSSENSTAASRRAAREAVGFAAGATEITGDQPDYHCPRVPEELEVKGSDFGDALAARHETHRGSRGEAHRPDAIGVYEFKALEIERLERVLGWPTRDFLCGIANDGFAGASSQSHPNLRTIPRGGPLYLVCVIDSGRGSRPDQRERSRCVSVALTVRCNISPTFSNRREEGILSVESRVAGFIGFSSCPALSRLEKLGIRWQALRGSSPCLPANFLRKLRAFRLVCP